MRYRHETAKYLRRYHTRWCVKNVEDTSRKLVEENIREVKKQANFLKEACDFWNTKVVGFHEILIAQMYGVPVARVNEEIGRASCRERV